jgi:hypothetical protein
MAKHPEPLQTTADWGPVTRVLFRFAFAYWVLFIVPLPPLWLALVPWVGRHLFHVDASVRYWFQAFNGAGDTTFHYMQVFCTLVLAAAAAAVWTALDRKRVNYVRLHDWLRVVVRFVLAAAMLAYGGGKVIPDQFPSPPLEKLVQPAGEALPVEFLWTFMGASAAYTIFTGAAEMLGGLLLTARKTALLGALICVGVLANVFMLNVGYDVPVKVLSFHLLAMAVFLVAPDLGRLANLLLFNRTAEPAALRPPFARPWLNRAALAFRTVLVAGLTGLSLWASYFHQTYYGDWAPRPPLYGVWEVSEFSSDGEVRPPLLTDAGRWRRVIVPQEDQFFIQFMDDSRRHYTLTFHADTGSLALTRGQDPDWKANLSYREPGPGLLVLEGTFNGRRVRVKLRPADDSKFRLVRHGFHWVHEPTFDH